MQNQKSAVRIQSLANFYVEHLFTVNCIERTNIKKKRPGKAHCLKNDFPIQDDLDDVLSDHDPFEPPLVSISSCGSTDPCSASVYESPLSSFNDSPTTSPSYATPMERSPWASPQSSIKSRSPTLSARDQYYKTIFQRTQTTY